MTEPPAPRPTGLLSRRQTLLAALGMLGATAFGADSTSRPKPDWSARDMPAQGGRTYLVTGGTSGLGYETALALAGAGAQVIVAARDDAARGNSVIASIRQQVPHARLQYEPFDLGDLSSVRALAVRTSASFPRLDGLINNAGIMAPPERGLSVDGFERQFAVNYLGHFALTAGLLPLLREASAPRVVTVSSIAANGGSIDFADLQSTQGYVPMKAYAQSKLACLMFAMELQRRSDAAGWGLRSVAVHPGIAVTELVARGPGLDSPQGRQWLSNRARLQTAAQGAVPALFAATAAEARGGAYYGPTGANEVAGPVGLAAVPPQAQDIAVAARLWAITEEITATKFPGAAR